MSSSTMTNRKSSAKVRWKNCFQMLSYSEHQTVASLEHRGKRVLWLLKFISWSGSLARIREGKCGPTQFLSSLEKTKGWRLGMTRQIQLMGWMMKEKFPNLTFCARQSTLTTRNLGRKWFMPSYTSGLQSMTEGSGEGNVTQKSRRYTADCLPSPALLCNQDYLPRDGAPRGGHASPTSIRNHKDVQ